MTTPTILAIDTASMHTKVGLLHRGEISQRIAVEPKQHGQLGLTFVDDLLAEAKLDINDCDAIAVNHGPGAFTSLRIGLSMAQGLAMGANLPMIGISSLAAAATDAVLSSPQCHDFLVCLDARMGEVYSAVYRGDCAETLSLVGEPVVMSPEKITAPDAHYCAVGDGWHEYGEQLPSQHVACCYCERKPSLAGLLQAADHRWHQDQMVAACDINPLYLRNDIATPKKT